MTPHSRGLPIGIGILLALMVTAGCSTTGRELRSPTMAPLAPSESTTTITAIDNLGGFAISSPAFVDGGPLPPDAGAQTGNVSPAIAWTLTPEDAAELALVASDAAGTTVHWLVTGLQTTDLIVDAGATPAGGTVRPNSSGTAGWTGPSSAEGTATTVVFRLYALDQPLVVVEGTPPTEVVAAISAGSFATATLTGTFSG